MKLLQQIIGIALLFAGFTHCKTTSTSSTQSSNGFEKIIYHSTRCFGSCPQIDMEIKNDRSIQVQRAFFELGKRGQEDSARSGNFKGQLSLETFNELIDQLTKSKYDSLQFPDITCCDGPVTTIIVYNKVKRTYLKSMMPPKEASELIKTLYRIGTESELTKTEEKIDIEQ